MTSSSSSSKVKEGKEVLKVQLIKNEIKQLNFNVITNIAYKQDSFGKFSMIPPQFLRIQDVRYCYRCKVGRIGDMEIRDDYEKLCENGVLK